MALRKTVTSNFGMEIPSAYIRVEDVMLERKQYINFMAKFYVDSNQKTPFQTVAYSCEHDLSGGNAIAQAYKYLKTVGEFSGAEDA